MDQINRWEKQARPFIPPSSHQKLSDALNIPGLICKFVPDMNGIKVRKRGRLYLWTGLRLWLTPDELEPLRVQIKAIQSGRTVHKGLTIMI